MASKMGIIAINPRVSLLYAIIITIVARKREITVESNWLSVRVDVISWVIINGPVTITFASP